MDPTAGGRYLAGRHCRRDHHCRRQKWHAYSSSRIFNGKWVDLTQVKCLTHRNQNDTSSWHLFYVDTNDIVRQKTFTNVTNVWQDGPVNNLNIQANNKPMVGLQACWFGNLYGDSEYIHSPQFDNPNVSTTAGADSTVGMHLFVGETGETTPRRQPTETSLLTDAQIPLFNSTAGFTVRRIGRLKTTGRT